MGTAARTALILLGSLVLAGPAQAESTTGAPGSDKPPPGNRRRPRLECRLRPAAAVRHEAPGATEKGDGGGGGAHLRDRLDPSVHLQGEGTGEAHREGSRGRPTQARLPRSLRGGINIGTGSTEIPFGDQPRTQIPFKPGFSTANIGETLTFPEQTKAGSGKVRAEQDIYFRVPFLGKCIKLGVGTSDTTTVEVLPARFDSTVITDLGVTAARQAQPVTLRWKLSRGGRARVTLYYLFTKNQSVPVSKLFDGQRSAGANDHTFPMSFDGKALPAGRYPTHPRARGPGG